VGETPESTFFCAACGGTAGEVWLLAPHATDPRLNSEPPGAPPGIGSFAEENTRVSISGPWSTTISPIAEGDVKRITAALKARDAAALYSIDYEFAPFWCPTCSVSYCADHWVMQTVFDDGFYDYTLGRCIQGHERMIAD
jgi:hypothetical protein